MTAQFLILLSVVATIAVNSAATLLPINGVTTAQLSDEFQVFFVPAGYVFAIWGVIYLGLIGYAVYQLLPAQRASQILQDISRWVLLSGAANIAWILLWHYRQVSLSLVAMLVLLFSLAVVYRRLKIGTRKETLGRTVFVNAPFSIYLAWICVATVANATVVLYSLEWDGLGLSAQVWTAIMLAVVVTLLTAIVLFRHKDLFFAAVILWAIYGIYVKFPAEELIANSVIVSMLIIILSAGLSLVRGLSSLLVSYKP